MQHQTILLQHLPSALTNVVTVYIGSGMEYIPYLWVFSFRSATGKRSYIFIHTHTRHFRRLA